MTIEECNSYIESNDLPKWLYDLPQDMRINVVSKIKEEIAR